MKNLVFTFALLLSFIMNGQSSEEKDLQAIRAIMKQQQEAWSNHDLESFMDGYWQSDSLTYYSQGKVNRGWQTTLNKYKKGYPAPKDTGELNFQIDDIGKINVDAYWVMGQYFLTREVGDASGTFMIIFKRIDGEWKIVADSSC